ncbi:MAG: ornithine cyclodeaminase family protein [Candidatus Bathyarchaeota archaeon]|nr:ornithine cyclodeaminase family protein [Candidatus Bathyarchaeota archaeon]
MLVLSDQDIAKLLSMGEAIEAVEGAFAQLRRGKVVMPTRSTIMLPRYNGSISFMPSYLDESGAQATKIISIYPDNPKKGLPTTAAWIVINNPETGQVEAFMDATYLTGVRTGAVSGVAAKYLAPKDAKIAAVFGAGAQARNQAWAAATVRKLEEIRVYDPIKPAVDKFAVDVEARLGIPIVKAASGEEACRDADMVLTATTSKMPVVKRKWLKDKVHVSAIGAFYPDWRELETGIIADAKVVIDEWEAIRLESGDILIPIQEGAITESHIHAELGELVTGEKKGRTPSDGITVFKSVGIAIQDSSVANLVFQKIKG